MKHCSLASLLASTKLSNVLSHRLVHIGRTNLHTPDPWSSHTCRNHLVAYLGFHRLLFGDDTEGDGVHGFDKPPVRYGVVHASRYLVDALRFHILSEGILVLHFDSHKRLVGDDSESNGVLGVNEAEYARDLNLYAGVQHPLLPYSL